MVAFRNGENDPTMQATAAIGCDIKARSVPARYSMPFPRCLQHKDMARLHAASVCGYSHHDSCMATAVAVGAVAVTTCGDEFSSRLSWTATSLCIQLCLPLPETPPYPHDKHKEICRAGHARRLMISCSWTYSSRIRGAFCNGVLHIPTTTPFVCPPLSYINARVYGLGSTPHEARSAPGSPQRVKPNGWIASNYLLMGTVQWYNRFTMTGPASVACVSSSS